MFSVQHTGTIYRYHSDDPLSACRVREYADSEIYRQSLEYRASGSDGGILFWGWLWGVMGLLRAVPLTAFIKLVADLHPSLCHLSNMLALTPRPTPHWVRYGETALERRFLTCGAVRQSRNSARREESRLEGEGAFSHRKR